MLILRRTICILLGHMLLPILAYTQTSVEVRQELDRLFGDMELNRVSTGILSDYSDSFIDFTLLDGAISDSNYVNAASLKSLLYAVKSASVNALAPEIDVPSFVSRFRTRKVCNSLNLGIVLYRYNYVKGNAVSDGLLNYDSVTDKYRDVYKNNVWINPYGEEYLIGFAPSSIMCELGDVTIDLSSLNIFTNIEEDKNIYLDASDGLGYRQISTSSSIILNYTTPGFKELKLRIELESNVVLYAHSMLHVMQETPTIYNNEEIVSDDGHLPKTFFNNSGASALVNVYLAPGHSKIVRPFIYVEGFDYSVLPPFRTGHKENGISLGTVNHKDFFKKWDNHSISNYYDLIYIDWNKPTLDIKFNAALLSDIINQINLVKEANESSEKNVIMGHSMGGLVARVALREMEKDGINHDTEAYISHDAPHEGVNLPIGLASLFTGLYSIYYSIDGLGEADYFDRLFSGSIITENDDVENRLNSLLFILHSTAVHQMLLQHPDICMNGGESQREKWIEYLDGLGFPKGVPGCEIANYAIVNSGSNINFPYYNNQYYFYLDFTLKSSFLLETLKNHIDEFQYIPEVLTDLFLSHVWGELDFKVVSKALTPAIDGSAVTSIELRYRKNKIFSKKYDRLYLVEKKINMVDFIPYDSYPSSHIPITNILPEFGDNVDSLRNEIEFPLIAQILYNGGIATKIPFVPTASALAIGRDDNNRWGNDFVSNPPIPSVDTPFQSFCLMEGSREHNDLSPAHFDWLQDQLQMNIDGPGPYVEEAVGYNITGVSDNSNVMFSLENVCNTHAYEPGISKTGYLNLYYPCSFDVVARSYQNGRMLYKKRRIIYLYPDIYLSQYYIPDYGNVVQVNTLALEDETVYERLVADNQYKHKWGYKVGSDPIQWTTNNDFQFVTELPDGETNYMVYHQLLDYADRSGGTLFMSINKDVLYDVAYKYMIINKERAIYFITENGYEANNGINELYVRFLRTEMNANDDNSIGTYDETYLGSEDCYLLLPDGTYVKGAFRGKERWSFDFFNTEYFLNHFNDFLDRESGLKDGDLEHMSFIICNSRKQKMQTVHFSIVYKETFPIR